MTSKTTCSILLLFAYINLQAETDYFNLNSNQNLDIKSISKSVTAYYFGNGNASKNCSASYDSRPLHAYHVISPSMFPLIPVGSKIFSDENVNFDEIQEGDIIVYRSRNYDSLSQNIVHRVYKKFPNYIVCKGDNNMSVDKELITRYNYQGKVVQINRPGWVASN